MSLSKIKETRLRKKFDKNLLGLIENRAVSEKEIRTVGILTTESISSKIDLQLHIEKELGVKNSKKYSFKKFDKVDFDSSCFFSEKDINWKGQFIETSFQSFLEQPFDLLIGYFDEKHLYAEMAVFQSKASFKAGFSGVNSNLYELEILEKTDNITAFSSELKRYLKILKKLKN